MASTDVLSQTLSSITAIKLDQLQKQKDAYESKKRSLCEEVVAEVDTAKRAKKLLKGSEELQPLGLKSNAALSSLSEFFDQAEFDPSVTEPLLKEYEAEIHNHLRAQTNKYEFASLYGKLVEEWIASGTSDAASKAEGSSFVVVGREEMHQQRATWEEYVFKSKETDGKATKAYLEDVFSSKETKRALESLRESMETYQKDWKRRHHFDESTLETVIKGMLRSDILTEEKRTTLRDFLGNKVVISEIADVLNMRMAGMSSWTWDTPHIVEQRRNLNGRYRFHTDEDLLHSMFVYYVGLEWATQLRRRLDIFIKTEGVWKSDTRSIPKSDARRRRFFLDDATALHWDSVQKNRDDHFHGILLDQLPGSFDEVRDSYGGLGRQQGDTKPSHVQVVQELLQRLQTEILMQTKLGREITVIRSDFKWFEWIGFKRVLEAKMRFKQDPPDTPAKLASVARPSARPLPTSWTGSARVTKGSVAAASTAQPGTLPRGAVKWGFLKLDPVTGRFLIDQDEVDKHIEELRLQLSACRSVLDYIQAWNIYGNRFFANNFGRPANCYGRAHVDSMLATFRRIQEKLFPDHAGGNPFIAPLLSRKHVEEDPEAVMDKYLKDEEFAYSRAKARFARHSPSDSDPYASDAESVANSGRWSSHSQGLEQHAWRDAPEFRDLRDEPFMSADEFGRYRERADQALGDVYRQLMRAPPTTGLTAGAEVQAALGAGHWAELSDCEKWVVQLHHRDMIARFGGANVVDEGLLPTGLITMLRESRFRWQG
ncbi:hypothetical protein NEMBOFW57_005317 [Staphylotrichum longicolle]|uniref:Uncharacterized protein n=1 Tax=Staphylotrichum longicolle TaxID=669026 RepID=A0AAD4EWU0_9PEZI|nr:hypothetical protein NEMBOFW57_005317 [Staphylotrichum longicolle]